MRDKKEHQELIWIRGRRKREDKLNKCERQERTPKTKPWTVENKRLNARDNKSLFICSVTTGDQVCHLYYYIQTARSLGEQYSLRNHKRDLIKSVFIPTCVTMNIISRPCLPFSDESLKRNPLYRRTWKILRLKCQVSV